jgi:hypothetical protein
MNQKKNNHKWQLNWRCDPEDSTVTHTLGLRYSFTWDNNGYCHQSICEDEASLAYVNGKKQTLSEGQFLEHMNKMHKQAREIFFEIL